MPSTDATLAWAIQVNVLTLGVHFEAYVNMLPTFRELRLCNRYGQGPDAFVAKLPPELVTIIEDFLIAAERSKLLRDWERDFTCFRLLCKPKDHITKRQWRKYIMAAKTDTTVGQSLEDGALDCLSDKFDDWCATHWDRCFAWQERVGLRSADDRGIFSDNTYIIKTHFGLSVWLSHVRLEDCPEDSYWEDWGGNEPPHTTVAFLTPPGASSHFRYGVLTEWERDEKEFFLESGYGMPVHLPGPLSQSAKTRFKRMMQILDLKPYYDESQEHMPLSADEDASEPLKERLNSGERFTPAAEPQLTMLIRNNVRSDEPD